MKNIQTKINLSFTFKQRPLIKTSVLYYSGKRDTKQLDTHFCKAYKQSYKIWPTLHGRIFTVYSFRSNYINYYGQNLRLLEKNACDFLRAADHLHYYFLLMSQCYKQYKQFFVFSLPGQIDRKTMFYNITCTYMHVS